MDSDTNQLLRDILEKTEENNSILKKMYRGVIWGRVFKALYLLIIVGAAVGAYYYIQPYVEGVLESYKSLLLGIDTIQDGAKSLRDVSSKIPDFGSLLKIF